MSVCTSESLGGVPQVSVLKFPSNTQGGFFLAQGKEGLGRLIPGFILLSLHKTLVSLNFLLKYTLMDGSMAKYRGHIIGVCWLSGSLSYNIFKHMKEK